MVSWWADGTMSSLRRDIYQGFGYLGFQYDGAYFASGGTVDAQIITRSSKIIACRQSIDRLYANPRIEVRPNEADTTQNTRRITGLMTVVPASTFPEGHIPTPQEIFCGVRGDASTPRTGIYDGNRQHYRTNQGAAGSTDGTGGFITSGSSSTSRKIQPFVYGPRYDTLEPNTKYWVALIPVWIHEDNWSKVSEIGRFAWTIGNTNNVGRAMSFWTYRTPKRPEWTGIVDNQLVVAGTVLNYTAKTNHPDAIQASADNDLNPDWFADVAGVHYQYSARPSIEDPDPEWVDMPFVDYSLSSVSPYPVNGVYEGRGWWIMNSSLNADETQPNREIAASGIRYKGKGEIVCGGSNPLTVANAGRAYLPAGDWRVRFRTFAYGSKDASPQQALSGPIGSKYGPVSGLDNAHNGHTEDGVFAARNYTPDSYPADLVSPWSLPLNISVTAQVPRPLLRYPVGGTALSIGSAVMLSWQYRNSAVQSYPQAARTIQIRKAGETVWNTLVSGNSSSPTYTIPSTYVLEELTSYEWRVKTQDSTGVESEYSATGLFWMVPQPNSGSVRPEAPSVIDGATLGIGTHRAFIYRKGGLRRVAELTGIIKLDWARTRDEISTAEVQIGSWDLDQGNLLANLKTWAYELVIFRDNGFSQHRVWEGPITLITYEESQVTIDAKDVMAYAYRRIVKQAMNDNSVGDSVVSRATRILQNVMAPDDPNVLSYLNPISNAADARQYRSLPPYSRTAYEEIDDMAANAGLDYAVVGRAILLWGTKYRIGTLPELRDKDLGASPIVSEYGMSFANRYVISDGNGVYGQATRLDEQGKDPDYGLVEMLSSTWAQDAQQDEGTYTQEGIETIRASFAEQAERSISDRYPPPVVVRIPDNTTLNPSTVLNIQQLVPGVVIPLRSFATLRTVRANQKLDSVKVTESDGTETIQVTMSPFNRDDNDQTEEGL